jgi:hypothetical protein
MNRQDGGSAREIVIWYTLMAPNATPVTGFRGIDSPAHTGARGCHSALLNQSGLSSTWAWGSAADPVRSIFALASTLATALSID